MTRSSKRSLSSLTTQYGQDYAVRVYREYDDALQGLFAFVEQEQIACYKNLYGRFVGANSPAHFAALAKECENARRLIGTEYNVVEKQDVHEEIASDVYHGGVVIPSLGSFHPGLYHQGLVDKAIGEGVRLAVHTEVLGISDGGGQKILRTSRGDLSARHVIVATNGYTTRRHRWFARQASPALHCEDR